MCSYLNKSIFYLFTASLILFIGIACAPNSELDPDVKDILRNGDSLKRTSDGATAIPYVQRMSSKTQATQSVQYPQLFIPNPGVDCSGRAHQSSCLVTIPNGTTKYLTGNYADRCSTHLVGKYVGNAARLRSDLEKLAVPTKERKIFYRWGNSEDEEGRIGLSPPFDFKYVINFKKSLAGNGLYVNSTVAGGSELIDVISPGAVTVVLEKNSLVLDLTDVNVQWAIRNLDPEFRKITFDDTSPNYSDHLNLPVTYSHGYPFNNGPNLVFDCNPAVAVKYRVEPASTPRAGSEWWVLKSNQNVTIEPFEAQYLNLDSLFAYRNVHAPANTKFHGPALRWRKGGLIPPHIELTRTGRDVKNPAADIYQAAFLKQLDMRIIHPENKKYKLPMTMTAQVPMHQWDQHPELKDLPLKDYIAGAPIEYFWRHDGTCGSYFRELILVENNVDKSNCEYVDPPHFCKKTTYTPTSCVEYLNLKGKNYRVIIEFPSPHPQCSVAPSCDF